jgi:peptidoglycan hydrolase-like protein with peptidoglycan-binding domain
MTAQLVVEMKTATSSATNKTQLKKPVLLQGFQGEDVLELQRLLRYWGTYSDPLNSIFNSSVEKAVRAFQHRVFLKEDGIVGQQTWQALYTGVPVNMPVLRRGSRDRNVVRLQEVLQASGLYYGAINGTFSSTTEESVQAFQRRCGLVPNGIVDRYTWLALSKVPH